MSRRKVTRDAQELAKELNIDPFEILLLMAAEKYEELGYENRVEVKFTKEGQQYSEFVIPPALRQQAAKEAVQYILPKRKAIEFSLDQVPDEAFDKEVERRIHLKILKGEKVG